MTTYELDFRACHEHFVAVVFTFTANTDAPTLWLPTWIAGSYLIREFAKNITNVQYGCGTQSFRAIKTSKNSWQLPHIKQGEVACVHYEVYCYDLSVRTAYVDGNRLFGNFTSLLLLQAKAQHEPCVISFHIPKAFGQIDSRPLMLATGLPFEQNDTGTQYHFKTLPDGTALNAFDAMDYPFEIAPQDCISFEITSNGKSFLHRHFISGIYETDLDRLKQDLTAICQCYADTLGWLPFDNYTFMTHATGSEYGGLEHINSTALITPRSDLPLNEKNEPSEGYQRFLGLCSHEYFHAWWVKSVRPDVMMTSDLQTEAYTPLLWVFEGFTSYVDDLMLYQSGVISEQAYLDLLTAQINRYENTAGKAHQTVAESSFDAWIKLYRPDENSPNSTISYYNKGALVAFGLDTLLMSYGKRLFEVVRHFVDKAKNGTHRRFGMSVDNLDEAMEHFLPTQTWQAFKNAYIDGIEPLPIKEWLSSHHIEMTEHADNSEPFGLLVSDAPLGLVVKKVARGSMAAQAGISAHDVIVAINGLKATKGQLQHALKTQKPLHIHAFCRDVLYNTTVSHSCDKNTVKISLKKKY